MSEMTNQTPQNDYEDINHDKEEYESVDIAIKEASDIVINQIYVPQSLRNFVDVKETEYGTRIVTD